MPTYKIVLLPLILLLTYLIYTSSIIDTPRQEQLTTITGTVKSIREIPYKKRRNRWHLLISIEHNQARHELVSYHRDLLYKLGAGDEVSAGIYPKAYESELWTLQYESGPAIYIADTHKARLEARGFDHLFGYAICIFFFIGIATGIIKPRDNSENNN